MDKLEIVKALLLDSNNESEGTSFPYNVGDKVFIQTMTLYFLGRVKEIKNGFVLLEDSSWVQDTGVRLSEFIKNGYTSASEIEPMTKGNAVQIINIINCIPWDHDLPKKAI